MYRLEESMLILCFQLLIKDIRESGRGSKILSDSC